MFRRLRYRKWLVAGIGLAALVAPTTALAGPQDISPAAMKALVVKSQALNARYGVNNHNMSPAAAAALLATSRLMNERYGNLRYGGTLVDGRSPDTVDAATAAREDSVTPVDGRSPDTIDFAAQAHSPVVTVVRDPGFQWGDFGIGGASALAAIILLGLSVRFLSNRQNRGGQRPVTTS